MLSLSLLKQKNDQAVDRALAHAQAENRRLRFQAGLPARTSNSLSKLNKENRKLSAILATRIDPNDPELQLEPIRLGDWRNQ